MPALARGANELVADAYAAKAHSWEIKLLLTDSLPFLARQITTGPGRVVRGYFDSSALIPGSTAALLLDLNTKLKPSLEVFFRAHAHTA